MKDMLSKEIAIYNKFAGLEDVYIPSVTSMMHIKASIERLTEGKHMVKFVPNLIYFIYLFFF